VELFLQSPSTPT